MTAQKTRKFTTKKSITNIATIKELTSANPRTIRQIATALGSQHQSAWEYVKFMADRGELHSNCGSLGAANYYRYNVDYVPPAKPVKPSLFMEDKPAIKSRVIMQDPEYAVSKRRVAAAAALPPRDPLMSALFG